MRAFVRRRLWSPCLASGRQRAAGCATAACAGVLTVGGATTSVAVLRPHRGSTTAASCEVGVSPDGGQRIVVVGGGIVGASIAFHLAARARRGRDGACDIVLVDEGSAGAATRMTWGYANAFCKAPLAYHQLSQLSVCKWTSFLRALGCPEAMASGALMWAADPSAAESLRARVSQAQRFGNSVRLVARDEFLEFAGPGVRVPDFVAGAFAEDELIVDTFLVARQAQARLVEMGGARRSERCSALLVRDGHVAGVVLAGGDVIEADVVIVAAGCGCRALLQTAGLDVPVDRVEDAPSYAYGVPPEERPAVPLLHRMRSRPGGGLIHDQLVSRPDGCVLLDGGALGKGTGAAKRRATWAQYVPAVATWPAASEPAAKPLPVDGLPIVGFIGEGRHLYVCVAHSGVTLGPLFGQLVAAEVADGIEVEPLRPFRPALAGRRTPGGAAL